MIFLILVVVFTVTAIGLGMRAGWLHEQRRRDEHAAAQKYLNRKD